LNNKKDTFDIIKVAKLNYKKVSMKIITEEMKFRKRMCDYALKYGATKAARRYHTNRRFVYRQLEKYDGSVRSLELKSRRPHSHPNAHKTEELELLDKVRVRYQRDGLAEIYVQARKRGYSRSYGSMCKQIRKLGKVTSKRVLKTSYVKHTEVKGEYPGDKVQVDIKYVPKECLMFQTYGKRYYQITAIDEYSRKRVLAVVDDKSLYHTSKFVGELQKRIGFKINTIQTDNGTEFVNLKDNTKQTIFEKTLNILGIEHKTTRPYSPWQNGKVERSHKIDNERFYNHQDFTSELDMKKKLARYNTRYNNVSRKVLGFKSPNQIVEEYAT